jgi:predicted membrane-bound spermidine synthase
MARESVRTRRVGVWAVSINGASGFAVMASEIAAGRLVAPYFGTSTTTWAALIGTILASMAVGNLLGARLSRRGRAACSLVYLLAAAFLLVTLLPLLAPPLMAGSLTSFRDGDVVGLATKALPSFALIALPMLLLGAVSPLVLHAIGEERDERTLAAELGHIAGRVYAAGTIGSLVGTYAAGLVLIPAWGTKLTMMVSSGMLLLAAVATRLLFVRSARVAAAVAVFIASIGLVGASALDVPRAAHDRRVIYSEESRFNHIEVLKVGESLQLRVNDGFATQSYTRLDKSLPLDSVWAHYALAPMWGSCVSPERVLILGLGGGTSAMIYRRLYPEAEITGVELDPAIPRVGAQILGVDLSGVRVVIDDARTFMSMSAAGGERWDVILIDAFQFPYIPFQLTTQEFFSDVATSLTDGGVVVMNVGRFKNERDVVNAVARTVAATLPFVAATDVDNDSNTVLIATRHSLDQAVGFGGLRIAGAVLSQAERALRRIRPPHPARWPEETELLTDDHAPVEWLTDRIVWRTLVAGHDPGT